METNETSSFKRKPLSDCTNTITSGSDRRKIPKSSISVADSRNRKPPKSSISILPDSTQSKTLKSSISIPFNQIYKPPKSSISIAPNSKTLKSPVSVANPPKLSVSIPAIRFKSSKSSISIAAGDDNPRVIGASSSPNSSASSGSGLSPNADACSPPASRPPPSVSDIGDHGKSGIPVSRGQRKDAKTRKDKGKMVVDTPIIQVSNPLPSPTQGFSSSAASGNDHLSGPDAIHNKNLNSRPQKDKGKMVFEAPSIGASYPMTPHAGLLVSSSSVSGDRGDGRSRSPISLSVSLDAKTRNDKGKMVMETPIPEISKQFTTPSLQLSSSVACDERHDGRSEPPVSQSLRLDAKARKDKGKMVVETPIIQISKPFTPSTLQLSSTAASGSSHLSTHDVIQRESPDVQPLKDKGKMVLEDLSIETSDPATPLTCQLLPSSSASGVQDQEKTKSTAVYGHSRYSLRRQRVGLTSAPLSCPRKRMKLKGVVFKDGDDQKTGSQTDPLPLHKKKQSRNKKNDAMHGMPQDEVERLKSYYADIDAFELHEEVASGDSD